MHLYPNLSKLFDFTLANFLPVSSSTSSYSYISDLLAAIAITYKIKHDKSILNLLIFLAAFSFSWFIQYVETSSKLVFLVISYTNIATAASNCYIVLVIIIINNYISISINFSLPL